MEPVGISRVLRLGTRCGCDMRGKSEEELARECMCVVFWGCNT